MITPTRENKPSVITVIYSLNTARFRDWVATINKAYMGDNQAETMLRYHGFMTMGLCIHIVEGKWDKAGFNFLEEGHEVWLRLQYEEARFRVHRDLFSQEEWCVYYEEPGLEAPSAAPTAV